MSTIQLLFDRIVGVDLFPVEDIGHFNNSVILYVILDPVFILHDSLGRFKFVFDLSVKINMSILCGDIPDVDDLLGLPIADMVPDSIQEIIIFHDILLCLIHQSGDVLVGLGSCACKLRILADSCDLIFPAILPVELCDA